MRMKWLLLSLLAPLAAAAPAAPAVPAEPRPALWLLADEDTRIYLFGTTHILPAALKWRSAALDRAIAASDELVTETGGTADDELGPDDMAPMLLSAPAPVLERVEERQREALRRLIADSGLSLEDMSLMQDWAVGMIVAVAAIEKHYRTGGGEVSGAERVLEQAFRSAGKPISGVETAAEQMGFLAQLSPGAQRRMLEETIDEIAAGDFSMMEGDDADWVRGDVDRIAASLAEAMPPEMYDILLTRRNARWTDWLERRLERPGTLLFAVGAGHLAGKHSVQAMLAGRGLKVERID